MSTSEVQVKKAVKPGRTKLYLMVAAAVVVGAIALDTKVVRVGSEQDLRQQAFDPDVYGQEQFPRIRDGIRERAPNAPQLVTELAEDKDGTIDKYGTKGGIGAVMPVRLTGVVGEGKSGVYNVTVEGVPEDTTIRVQTGPAINGTDLRDFPGDIAFGQFTNQIEYQNAGSGINRAMAAEALGELDRETLTGKTIHVTGVFRLINPKNWLITPVELEVEQ